MVSGYDADTESVDVVDPFYGESVYDYDAFCNRYESVGSWTHSYWTRPRQEE